MGRAPCCEKVGLKKGRWTAEEDEILAKYIQLNGEGSWRSLPKNAGLLRCGKSCRLRWINYLRADLKRGNISPQEEDTIVKLHTSFGNRWSLIASHLPGRTDNEIKNYWNSHLSRKIYTTTDQSTVSRIIDTIPPKRKGGRTSRWAMKKNKNYTTTTTQNDVVLQRPKQIQTTIITQQNNNEPAVPLPPTPSLDTEFLSNGVINGDGDDILGINGGGALSFSDVMDICSLEEAACGVSTLTEERESTDDVACAGEENENQNGTVSVSVVSSDYSMDLGLEELSDHWDWENLIELSNNDYSDEKYELNLEHRENLLSWLWEDDDWENDCLKLGETDPQKQNDMLAWFLS